MREPTHRGYTLAEMESRAADINAANERKGAPVRWAAQYGAAPGQLGRWSCELVPIVDASGEPTKHNREAQDRARGVPEKETRGG